MRYQRVNPGNFFQMARRIERPRNRLLMAPVDIEWLGAVGNLGARLEQQLDVQTPVSGNSQCLQIMRTGL